MNLNVYDLSVINAVVAYIKANFGHRLTPENKTAIAAYDYEDTMFEVYDYGNHRYLKVYDSAVGDGLSIHIGERPEQTAPDQDIGPIDPNDPNGGGAGGFEERYAMAA